MTITATPSSPNANSFVEIAFADAYFLTMFGADAWDTFDLVKKEALLITATNRINLFLFGGTRAFRTQSLAWPRLYLTDQDGYVLDSNTIPHNIKKATCEMAFWIWTEDDRMLSDTDLKQIESFKAGPLDIKVNIKAITVPPVVEQLIKAIGPGVLLSVDGTNQNVSFVR